MTPAPDDSVVIVSYARTPFGAFQGSLAAQAAPQLGAAAIAAAVQRAGANPADIDQVIMGCVLAAGLGQAPARQAALGAGLPLSAAATTVNKMCGSGMQAVILAHEMLRSGSAELLVAGGMESMSNAPYLVARRRRRMGHDTLVDSMLHDGLEDAERAGVLMGQFAEDASVRHDVTREAMDEYAARSLERALNAQRDGYLAAEIAPLGATLEDEQPGRANASAIRTLAPAFARDGRITAASSSSIADGAAALVVTRASIAARLGLPVAARIAGHSAFAGEAASYPTAPAHAITLLVRRLAWWLADVGLFEVNEAFAMVPMLTMSELGIDPARMNVRGGACALGHPIGASGARITGTLVASMRARAVQRGIAAACLGGGEALAIALELP